MADDAAFCYNWGQALVVTPTSQRAPMINTSVTAAVGGGASAIPAYAGYAAVPRVEYAGFWLRFLALLIDNAVMGLGFVLILIPLIFLTGLSGFLGEITRNEDLNDVGIFTLVGLIFLGATVGLVFTWLYHALMESSEWQATVGEKVLGLVVTDMGGAQRECGGVSGKYVWKMITNQLSAHIGEH